MEWVMFCTLPLSQALKLEEIENGSIVEELV